MIRAADTRRYREQDVDTLQALACLRAMGVGIEEMRIYQANRELGHARAGERRDLLLRHAERVEAEIETLPRASRLPTGESDALGHPRPCGCRRGSRGEFAGTGRSCADWRRGYSGERQGAGDRRVRLSRYTADRDAPA